MDNIYTVKEVAELLVVRPETVRRWIHEDKLDATKQADGFTISEEALMNFAFRRYKYARLLCANVGPRMALMYNLWRTQVPVILAIKRQMQNPNYAARIERLREAIEQLKREED